MNKIILISLFLFGCNYDQFTWPDCKEVIGLIKKDGACLPRPVQKFKSPGGDIRAGLVIQSLSETVVADVYCNSMCAIILITSKRRIACAGAQVGFHRSDDVRGDELIRDVVQNYVEDTGAFDYDYFSLIFESTPNDDVYYADLNWMLSVGMIDEINDCDDGDLI